MGYRKEKSQKFKNEKSVTNKVKTGWRSRYPVFLFVGRFLILMIVFYMFWFSHWADLYFTGNVVRFNAKVSSAFLDLFGWNTHSIGSEISSPIYSISVAKGCDGIEAMAVFIVALISFPLNWKRKVFGIIYGVLILASLNFIRIISLFILGVNKSAVFESMHSEVWPIVFILASISIWGVWLFRSYKPA